MRRRPALRVVPTGNVVPLRSRPPLHAPQRRAPGRGRLVAATATSVAIHAALLYLVQAPRVAEPPPPPTPLEVVLVEPAQPAGPAHLAPEPPAQPVPQKPASAPPRQKSAATPPPRPRQQERPREEPPRRTAADAPKPPTPKARPPAAAPAAPLAVPRGEPPPVALSSAPPAAPAGAPSESPHEQAGATAAGAAGPPRLSAPSFNAAYLHNPAPAYPLIARRNGQQGTVTLRVLVTREGLPAEVVVETTSGFPALDAAALATVKQWRFVPAQQGGRAVQAQVLVPVVFRLRDAS